MSMRSLENKEMIQLSTTVLTPGSAQHDALSATPCASVTLPVMQAAHDDVVAVESGDNLDQLSAERATLSDQHDSLVTRVTTRIDAEIAAATVDTDRVALEQARDEIFPPGESVLRASFSAKAGAWATREHRVTPATLALLATVPIRGGGTLADTYAQLQAATHALSVADGEHQAVVAAHAGPRVRKARKRWVAAVELIDRSMRALGLDPAPVLGGIRAAQAAAVPGHAPVATPAPAPAPVPVVTNGSTPHA